MLLILMLSSILSTVLISVLIIFAIGFLIYSIAAYILFCMGLKRFLIKNQLSATWYWLPIYNLYLMGKVIEKEIGEQNLGLKYAKYILPIGFVVTYFLHGKIQFLVLVLYTLYGIFCYYRLGKKYHCGVFNAVLSFFMLQGVGMLIIRKRNF